MKPRCLQDDLIKRLGGPDKVAELTGRKKRMVYNEKTKSYHYKARFDKVPMDQVRPQACSHACCRWSCKQGLKRVAQAILLESLLMHCLGRWFTFWRWFLQHESVSVKLLGTFQVER